MKASVAGMLEQTIVIAYGSSVWEDPRQLLKANICTSVPEDFFWTQQARSVTKSALRRSSSQQVMERVGI